MTAAFNSVLSYPPYPNNKYLCILDDVATHARAITNQLTLFRQKKGNHSVSRAVGFNIQNGFDFWRDKERGERERERERHGSPTWGQTAPDRIVDVTGELWNIPIMVWTININFLWLKCPPLRISVVFAGWRNHSYMRNKPDGWEVYNIMID